MEYSYQKVAIVRVFLVVAFLGIFEAGNAQIPCNMTFEGLMACRPSATPPTPTSPSANCCTALSNANMTCLCSFKNSKTLPSLGIDPTLAMQLPDKCKLPHPAQC